MRTRVLALLQAGDFPANLPGANPSCGGLPPPRMIRPLLSLLTAGDEDVKARAATALGLVTERLAALDMEAARNVMRRLMWTLNDESGSIGWGAPQAMAEIMVRHEALAREYAAILVSYMRPDGNYLEHPPLQRDLLQGMASLAEARPRLLLQEGADRLLVPYLSSPNAHVRGLAAWCSGCLGAQDAREPLQDLREDPAEIVLRQGSRVQKTSIGALARTALAALAARPGQSSKHR